MKGIISRKGFASWALASLGAIVAAPIASGAELVWRGDAETGDFSQFRDHLYGEGDYTTKAVVTGPTRAGNHAVQLTVLGNERPGGRERAELYTDMPNGGGALTFDWDGDEYWVGFSVRFDEGDPGGWTLFQIHSPSGSSGSECFMGGNAFGIYPTGEDSNNGAADRLEVRVIEQGGVAKSSAGSNTTGVHSAPLTRNTWHDYVVRMRLSKAGQGFFEVWKDGQKVYSKFGLTNVDHIDGCGNAISDQRHYGAQFGIYTDNAPIFRRVYFDELKIAVGADGYDLVAPAGSGSGQSSSSAAKPLPPSNFVAIE